jgi:hypothetical protein
MWQYEEWVNMFYVKLGKTFLQTYNMIREACGNKSSGQDAVYR